ncbi:MAG: SDR family NAD(P)-dependent oxidoreductase [Solirubrobacterales bacterium]
MSSYSERRRLENRHLVVTGARGGIGQALCRRLHADGARLTVVNRAGSGDDELWRELDAEFVLLDVASPRAAIAAAMEPVGPVDGLVNVAAVESVANFPDYEDEEIHRVLDVNFRGPLHLTQVLRDRLAPGSSIVNVITMDALLVLRTTPKSSALYAASKAALATLTRELASELGPDGIRVNGVAPGLIDTPPMRQMPAERREWIVERTALKRIGEPAEVADVISFLLSEAARFVSGEVLPVDGGMAAALYGPAELLADA